MSRHLRKPSALSNGTQDSHLYHSNPLNHDDSGGAHAFSSRVNVGEQIAPKIHGDQDSNSINNNNEDLLVTIGGGLAGDDGLMLSDSSCCNTSAAVIENGQD